MSATSERIAEQTGAARAPITLAPSPRAQFTTLAWAMLRGYYRDRTALFFTFFFPLMFLVVFGLIFNNAGASKIQVGVVGSGPVISGLPGSVLEVKHYADADAAIAAVRSGDLPGVLIENGKELTLRYAASDRIKSGALLSIINATVGQLNQQSAGRPPTYTVTGEQVEDSSLKAIQYITPGMLSWGVATSAVFGAALTLVNWRKTQLLRRLRLSPAPVWTVVAARIGVSLLVALVQAAVFIGVALTPPFGLQLTGQWYLALPLLLVGTVAFLSIGLLVGSIGKTVEAAQAMANFVVLPMAFLSGTFFDISAAPAWLQTVSKILPLRWMNDGMLDLLVRGKGVEALWLPLAVMAGFALVVGGIATRIFRWDDA